jgi:hypothetical protein
MLLLAADRRLRESAVHDLIDGVNRFPLAGTAPKDEHARDEMELRVIGIGMALVLAILTQDDGGNAHGLSAVAA